VSLFDGAELKLPPSVAGSKMSAQAAAGMVDKSAGLRSETDSPLYAECVQTSSTGGGKPAISYVLLRPGSDCNTTTIAGSVPDAVCAGSPAYSDRGHRFVRRRSSVSEQGDLRALTERLEQLGAVDLARSLATTVSDDAVAWTLVTNRGCCISLPHSGIGLGYLTQSLKRSANSIVMSHSLMHLIQILNNNSNNTGSLTGCFARYSDAGRRAGLDSTRQISRQLITRPSTPVEMVG